MKKSICLLFILLACLPSTILTAQQSSNSTPPSISPIQGRLGVGGSLEYVSAEAKLKVKPARSLSYISSNQSHIAKQLQFAPAIELGVTIWDTYYLGFYANWCPVAASNTSRSPIKDINYFQHSFKLDSYLNAFIKPGYRFTSQLMVYGLIGPSIAKWSHTTEHFTDKTLEDPKLISSHKTSNRSVGLGIGLGLEYLTQYKFALGFDYTYYLHRSKTESKKVSYVDSRPGMLGYRRSGNLVKTIKPSYSVFAMRLTYFFSVF